MLSGGEKKASQTERRGAMSFDMIAIEQWGLRMLGVPKAVCDKRLKESVECEIKDIERSREVHRRLKNGERIRFNLNQEVK